MKVLVTGGTGFTGSHLVRRILERGDEARVLDNQRGLVLDELEAAGAEILLGSITDAEVVNRAVEGCEVVHHLAAAFRQLNVPAKHYRDVNVQGTRNVMEAALRSGTRKVVYCSTQGVHGHVENPPGDEDSPISPADYYQQTKYEGEAVVLEFTAKGVPSLILRPTAIYGPGDPARFLILFRLAARGSFWMFGDGEATYHPVYIDNLVGAFEAAAKSEREDGRAYLIGDEHYYSLNELVRLVGEAIDVQTKVRHLPFRPLWLAAVFCEGVCKPLRIKPPLFRRRVDWFRQVRAFRIDRARSELGYEPKVGIHEGLRRTGQWYRAEGYLG